MKFFRLSVFAVLAISLALFSCESKEDEKKNEITVEGKSYETPKGFLTFYGANDENSSDFDVVICSSNINYDAEDDEFYGTGSAIYIDFNSPSLTELASGTYTFDAEYYADEAAERQANTFVDAEAMIGGNSQDLSAGTEYNSDETSSGTVTIKKSGSEYEIEYNLTLENEVKVKGYFKGSLELIDYSQDWGKAATKTKKQSFSKL